MWLRHFKDWINFAAEGFFYGDLFNLLKLKRMHLFDSCLTKFNEEKPFPVCARPPTLQPNSDLNLGLMGLLVELFKICKQEHRRFMYPLSNFGQD